MLHKSKQFLLHWRHPSLALYFQHSELITMNTSKSMFWNSFLQIHSTYIKLNVVVFDSSNLVCLCSIFTHSCLFLQIRNMDLEVFIVISSLCWKYNANDGCLQWSRYSYFKKICLTLWEYQLDLLDISVTNGLFSNVELQ
jgi:hypothetical protein